MNKLFSFFLKSKKKLESFIADFIEEIPAFLDEMSASYRTKESSDHFSRVERLLKGFLQKDKILFGKESVYRVHGLFSMARFYKEHYRYAEAEKHYRQGTALLFQAAAEEEKLPYSFREYASEFIKFLSGYCKYGEAENYQQELIRLSSPGLGPKEKALDLAELALLCQKNGKPENAASFFRNAVELFIDGSQPVSSELAEFLEARIFQLRHEGASKEVLKDAKELLFALDALLISRKAVGQDHHLNLAPIDSLISIYRRKSKEEHVSQLLLERNIIFLARKVGSAGSYPYPALKRDLEELAALYQKRQQGGDATLAFHALKRAKELRTKL